MLVAENAGAQVGYAISQDRYFKHDDIGIIYQLNVVPDRQRGLIGATLIREVFARSAYGCKLYCCWCAQNLDANYFWESIGFIPLAFRTGARGKGTRPRTHIFWQRRNREGDNETPYWFPAETSGGSMRENRLVLPIPPGTCWKDVMPVLLPGAQPQLADKKTARRECSGAPAVSNLPKPQKMPRPRKVQFGRPPAASSQEAETVVVAIGATAKPKREKKPHAKNNPQHVAAARELRDRYLEQFNAGGAGQVLGGGKYDVARPATSSVESALPAPGGLFVPAKQLPAAA